MPGDETDGEEVNTYGTNPTAVDPDHDGLPDPVEIAQGTNPNVADTGVLVQAVTGGDAGEGLDLDGNFLYAFSILPDTGAIGQVRDANFTSENVEGVSVTQATSMIPNWFVPEFGDTPNDDTLEFVIQNIRHGGGGAIIALSNLVVGTSYKLQLIFGEACCARAMDILVNGKLIADEFAPYEIQGGINNVAQAAVVAYQFVASTNRLVVQTQGSTVTTPRYTDRNPIINAVTLENVGIGPVQPKITGISLAGGVSIVFDSIATRSYTLEYKGSLSAAAWESVGNVTATGSSTTIQDNVPAHSSAPSGFWRIRAQ
jgi:hypothetical protein